MIGFNISDDAYAGLSALMIFYGLFLGSKSAAGKSNTRIISFIILLLPFAIINILISPVITETTIRWILWFGALLGMYMIALRSSEKVDDALCKNTAPAFFLIWAFLAFKGNALAESRSESIPTLHLSAFYANLLVASALFLPNKFYRILFVVLGVAGALTSGSRAAFIFLPALSLPGIVYYYKIRLSSITLILLIIGGLFLVMNNETLFSATFGRKTEDGTTINSIESAERSSGGRADLRQKGIDLAIDQPWGYGYGNTFSFTDEAGKNMGRNLHNGYLNVLTQMGLHLFLFYVGFIFWVLFKLMTTQSISRRSRYFTLSILCCVFLRALSESFSFFDLGHPAAFFSMFLISLFIIRLREVQKRFN